MSEKKTILMLGYPATGKTTFLAALWYVLNNNNEVPGSLRLMSLGSNREYLNAIMDKWLTYEDVGRTPPSSETTVSLDVSLADGVQIELLFPDVSGERFRQQFEDRMAAPEFFEKIGVSFGGLLFIHSDRIDTAMTISQRDTLAAIAEGGSSDNDDNVPEEIHAWDPSRAPTQVKLVDLLQVLVSAPGVRRPFRLAVIVSAWDLIGCQFRKPSRFLISRLPLLHQYLESNPAAFKYSIYGVSALGGRIDLEASLQELQQKNSPSERILVLDDKAAHHDITSPLKWLAGQ